MPWKFILFIVICIVFSIFIGFNITYTSTIDFLFVKVENAPVFLVVLLSFLAGSCVGLLASILKKTKKRKEEKLRKKAEADEETPLAEGGEGQEPTSKKRRGRKRK